METELWPHLIRRADARRHADAARQRAPLGTLGEGLRRFGDLARGALEDLACVAAQTEDDAERGSRISARATSP
jgi:3-deoxy-D-manno-octulosonic-acid transferase